MDDAGEISMQAFEDAPVPLQVLRMRDLDDLGSFYPVLVNDAVCQLLQQDMKADIGKTWRETAPELVDSEFPAMFKNALDEQKQITWELEYGDSRFKKAWWRGTGRPLDDRTIILTYQDVTKEKVNTMELERSNRELDDFAYVASHDLRSPLRDIDNLAKWIAEDLTEVPEATAKHISRLRQRVTRMEGLLRDLLDYSRAGRVYAKPESFDLKSTFASVQELLPNHGDLTIDFPESNVTLFAPRPPFELILRNLISNAIKHHDRANGHIAVSCETTDTHVHISIADDGPGIPPDLHEKAFGMFQTLRPRDHVEGSGMGLAVCRKLAEAYGESLTLDPTQERGAVFRFTWPLRWDGPEANDE